MGVFEMPNFAKGTIAVAQALADIDATTPPPIIKVSTFSNRLLITEILEETFEPPKIATNGRAGLLTAFPRKLISFSIK